LISLLLGFGQSHRLRQLIDGCIGGKKYQTVEIMLNLVEKNLDGCRNLLI
jgi:hypothetical protein